jgi:hypothetical protein
MKVHLFWLPLIGALLAFKAFPSIRYEDKDISKRRCCNAQRCCVLHKK